MNGLHLIADLYRCRPRAAALSARRALESLCVAESRRARQLFRRLICPDEPVDHEVVRGRLRVGA